MMMVSSVFLLCLLMIFVLAALIGFWTGSLMQRRNREAEGWSVAPGVVTSSDLEIYKTYDTAPPTRMYRLLLMYEYEVYGVHYTASNIRASANADTNLRKQQEKKLEKYPLGQPVDVYYNPQDPADALLEINPARMNAGMIVGVIALVGIVLDVLALLLGVVQHF